MQEEILELRATCNNEGGVSSNTYEVWQEEDYYTSFYLKILTVEVLVCCIVWYSHSLFLFYFTKILLTGLKSRLSRMEQRLTRGEFCWRKRFAYRVDVFFSIYTYAKLLALLAATIILIVSRGLALYAVSDASLAEAVWLSWTFVANAGNHADKVGTGPRIVSVSITCGGMLVFAMMLGIISDAISEKVDSLWKGKSVVVETNHILILRWSDKLVICTNKFEQLCPLFLWKSESLISH